MSEDKNHIVYDELIARYLSGELTEQEEMEVVAWVEGSVENGALLDRSSKTFEVANRSMKAADLDEDAAWKKLRARITAMPAETEVRDITEEAREAREARRNPMARFRMAAAMAIITGLVALLYNLFSTDSDFIVFASNEEVRELLLPDGSAITLNKNSEIKYPSDFGGGNRTLQLEGEAFFDVKHDPALPFIVRVPGGQIKVLGTSFSIYAYPDTDTVSVAVLTGTVLLSPVSRDSTQKGVELTKGHVGKLFRKSGTVAMRFSAGLEEMYWKTKTLIFQKTELAQVIRVLNETYGAQIEIKSSELNSCKLSTTFKDEPLDAVLSVLSDTFGITVRSQNGRIELTGDGC